MKGLIVFIKNPELGKVKTRLAITMGEEMALEIYKKLIGYTRNVLQRVSGIKKYVFYSSFIDYNDDWDNQEFDKQLQTNGELGTKMTEALKVAFEECAQVAIIGSDCPQLLPKHIQGAFDKLADHNVVIGPSKDGGYYLMALDNYYPQLFAGITWSTETVLSETLEKAVEANLRVATIETLADVDFEDDWKKYGF